MQVSKPIAIFGFNFCTTVFIGLSLYGLALYMSEGLLRSDSLVTTAAYAIAVLASIAGICFFGREADRRKSEEVAKTAPVAPLPARKSKKT